MGVGEVDLDAVDGFGFVFLFGLQDELFEDGVVAGYDATGDGVSICAK